MKKLLSLGITIAVIVAMVLTCPKEEDHYKAISSDIAEKSAVLKTIGPSIVKMGVKKVVTVKDYMLVSVGNYSLNDKNGVVSIGLFGHVFPITQDDFWDELGRSIGLN